MDIQISNCNNISKGDITVRESILNLKYAINGTGKSTIAKAIESAAKHDDTALKELTPYSFSGDNQPDHQPSVNGLPEDLTIAVFDENYVNQYVFLDDELLKNSFEVFVKTDNFEQRLAEINNLVARVHTLFEYTPELETMLKDMQEFIEVFGNSTSKGIANNSSLVKGFSSGNLIHYIPEGLEDYSVFLKNEQNSKWLKWQANGREYMALGNKCPFCAGDIAPRREKIEQIEKEYNPKTIEHLSKILGIFEKLGCYFSVETNNNIREITQSVQGLSLEQKKYLVGIKQQVEAFFAKLNQLKNIGFYSLKDIDRIADAIPSFKIDIKYLHHLNSDFTNGKVSIINQTIEQLNEEIGQLQGLVNQQKREIQETVRKYNTEINTFLQNAGYNYKVSIDETSDHSYKLMLKFNEDKTISGVKNHLSFGERNAFALVLFMYYALHIGANFIILDDPISSFDRNKKFAILDMLFIRGGSLRGKTTLLLTHDFEPVIDAIYNHSNFFQGTPEASFIENIGGILKEKPILKNDILSSVQVAQNNVERCNHVLSKIIYLRRLIEVVYGKIPAWHLLSNLFHKREIPITGQEREMSPNEINEATDHIKQFIPDFDYSQILALVSDQKQLLDLYHRAESNYEKLQIYRIINGVANEDHVMRKFINETYHIENDYLFQLNPVSYNTIPSYIIDMCDQAISAKENRIN